MNAWASTTIGRREWRVCIAMNRWAARHALAKAFSIVSRLGDGVFWYALMASLVGFGDTRGVHAALHMALVGVVAATLYRKLKRWTRRPRPFRAHHGIIAYVAPLDEYSFPSGHTLHAVSFSLVALMYFPWLLPILAPFAILVAMSRVVLGLHYPSDVLAATIIGGVLATASWCVTPASWLA